jgi:hypothetical protein
MYPEASWTEFLSNEVLLQFLFSAVGVGLVVGAVVSVVEAFLARP